MELTMKTSIKLCDISDDAKRANPAFFLTETGAVSKAETKPIPKPGSGQKRVKSGPKTQGPNKGEQQYYLRYLLPRLNAGELMTVKYEGVSLKMINGHRYTPDWVCWTATGQMECHEVKGAYRLHSHQRAKLAFDQCRVEFPQIKFVWYQP
jgi:hypothetical protein